MCRREVGENVPRRVIVRRRAAANKCPAPRPLTNRRCEAGVIGRLPIGNLAGVTARQARIAAILKRASLRASIFVH